MHFRLTQSKEAFANPPIQNEYNVIRYNSSVMVYIIYCHVLADTDVGVNVLAVRSHLVVV